jgi:SNF2 family DNA or RNA helicase
MIHHCTWIQHLQRKLPADPVLSFCAINQRKESENMLSSRCPFAPQEMGLGKTVEILGLILANPHPNPPLVTPQVTVQRPVPPIPEGGVPSKATLVVCAVSLVGQWISEAKGKLSAPVNMYKYHGSSRTRDPFFLAGQDIVSARFCNSIVSGCFPQRCSR